MTTNNSPQPKHFRIFLSSPDDVAEERRLAREVIESVLPQRPALRGRASFEVVAWDHPEGYVALPAGLTPQAAINRGLPKPSECDVTIVILWGRMGSPLPGDYRKADGSAYLSGTEWEFEDARQAKPESVLVYRRTSPPQPQSDDPSELREMAEQSEQRNRFLSQFRNDDGSYTGSVNTYDTPAAFREQLTNHLETIVLERLPPAVPKAQPSPPGDEPGWEFPDLHSNSGWLAEAVQIERSPHYRQDVAQRLHSERWGRRYLRMLEAILAQAERIWGPRGSSQAFITCVFFSLVYAYALFWLSLASGAANPFGEAAGLREISKPDLGQRFWLFGLEVLHPVALWPFGRWLGYIEKRFRMSQRGKRSRLYRVLPGAMIVVLAAGLGLIVEQSGQIEVLASLINLGMFFAVTPILGVAWGSRARTPWRALVLSMFAFAFAFTFGLAVTRVLAVASVLVVILAVTLAVIGAGAFVFAGACVATGVVTAIGAVTGALTGAFALGGALAVTGVVTVTGAAMSVRTDVKRVNLFAAIIGGFAIWAFFGFLFNQNNNREFVYFGISMLILPVMNGGIDYASWWVSRWLGHDLATGLSANPSTAATLARSLAHIAADLLLALVFFVAMAFALGLAFESYDLYANLDAVVLYAETEAGPTGYAADLRNDPLGQGLWITLMLLTTLIPTVIHFGMVIGAILPATLLPDARRRQLASNLAALGPAPPAEPQARAVWAKTIQAAATFAAAYRWRMAAGVALTSGLLAALLWGLGRLYPHVFLTDWAYQGGVLGIKTARWLFGPG